MSDGALPHVVVHDLYMEEIEVYKYNFFWKMKKTNFVIFLFLIQNGATRKVC